jgi:hypothetical protein
MGAFERRAPAQEDRPMKTRLVSRSLLAMLGFAIIATLPAAAQTVYENGPINGNTDAWTINFGFIVSDSFTISGGSTTLSGLSFGAWLFAGDTLTSAEVWITSQPDGGTTYFNQTVNFTGSGCAMNQYGFNDCEETGLFSGPTLNNGTYWLNLENASVPSGDPVYWDENSGIGCTSEGCPSEACEGNCEGSIPSEAFTLQGTSSGTGTVPEPASLVLVGGGFLAVIETLRRRFYL